MSIADFRESLGKFEKEKIDYFLNKYNVNTLQNGLGCVILELF